MLKIDDIIAKVGAYNDQADFSLIRKAYDYSAKAHEGQRRLSGHPFVVHPLEVANILSEMKLDVSSIVAGILHDTIEDTETTKQEISAAFGPDIYLHYTFPRPGIYVIFSEFKHNNKVVTTKFMVEVEPSNGGTTNLMLGHGH